MTLAFLAAAFKPANIDDARVTPKPEPEVERLAAEKKLVASFNSRLLDARPVIWSLYHHPEEWQWHGGDRRYNLLTHMPTNHHIQIRPGEYAMYSPECSCSTRGFQAGQQDDLETAVRNHGTGGGDRDYPKPTVRGGFEADQFAGHFIR